MPPHAAPVQYWKLKVLALALSKKATAAVMVCRLPAPQSTLTALPVVGTGHPCVAVSPSFPSVWKDVLALAIAAPPGASATLVPGGGGGGEALLHACSSSTKTLVAALVKLSRMAWVEGGVAGVQVTDVRVSLV